MDRTCLEELLAGLTRANGTTLHLMAGQPPFMRIQDNLIASDDEPLSAQVLTDLARDFLFADHRQKLENGEEVEVLYASQAGDRFRTTVIPQSHGLSLVFRRVPSEIPTFEQLELPELLGSFVAFRSGLVLLTGFVGAGKSTTLAALVDRINSESPVHIVSIEDSIEFIHRPKTAIVHQREVGTHVDSVASGVRHAVRQGAEVIVVGELADFDGLRAVLDAVEHGCLVLAAFSASSVVAAIADLFRMVPQTERARIRFRFAEALRTMMSQMLIPRRHGNGRIPVLEIMIRNKAVARAIRNGTLHDLREIMVRGRGLGMQTTDMALKNLLGRHLISVDEAACHALDKDWVCSRVAVTPG